MSIPYIILSDSEEEDEPMKDINTPPPNSDGESHNSNAPTHPSTLPIDPYLAIRPWNWLPTTLQEWREEEKIPPITKVGESSTTPQNFPFTHEPPHHTVPLLVTRTIRHEDRLDHIEDALEAMPGEEAMEDVHDHITNLGNHVVAIRDVTEDLRQRAEEDTYRTTDLGERVERIEERLDQLSTLVNSLRDSLAPKGGHPPKK